MTNRFRALVAITLLALLAGCAPVPAAAPPAPAAGPFELTLVHSNDTWGYLFPCG